MNHYLWAPLTVLAAGCAAQVATNAGGEPLQSAEATEASPLPPLTCETVLCAPGFTCRDTASGPVCEPTRPRLQTAADIQAIGCNLGESFPAGDGCNTCSCTERGVVCTMMACPVRCGGIAGFECPAGLTCEYGPECEGVSDCMGTCVPAAECTPVTCRLYCEYGFTDTDGDGCEDCACAKQPASFDTAALT